MDRRMIEQVYISGKIGRAIYLENERYFSLGVADEDQARECRSGDLSFLIDSSGEYKVMSGKNISIDSIKDALVVDTTNQRALSLCISGMDPVLSDNTRLLSIEAAEELIQEKPVYKFVKNRFLARILPESAEVESAISLADSAHTDLISELYENMLASQESIRVLQNVWQNFAPQYFDELDEKSAAESVFIENGLFADMVDAAVKENKSEMKLLTVTYGSNRELSNSLPSSKRSVIIINNFVNDFLAKLNFAGKKAAIKESVKTPDKPVVVDPIKQLIQDFGIQSRQQVQKSRRMGSEAVKEKVDQQIMQIERLIQQNNIQRTDSYLFDLVKFQLEHGKKEFLAMTLCNLAKTAMDLNDLATAERLITYAGLLGVEDPVIPSTQAELLRRNGFTKEALVVYEETISLFPEDVVAKSGRAEVLKEMNELDKALAAYDETISQFPNDVVAKNGRAEVLKEMNELDEALAAFDETINLFPNDVFAKNGRAEVLKEMNKLDEALAAYDETINQFPNEVVPKNGRAEVLKEMNELDKALVVYEETISQ
ncbi:tetratricopeptide repeat protein, partial [candidate division KSB1 bacterium]|nr:tetratricopeptide repeat protein [candidate division KSB1 bacterium]